MENKRPVVAVVDDDPSILRSLARLLRSVGIEPLVFASGAALLEGSRLCETQCFVLDVHMPHMTGYQLADRLSAAGSTAPLIFITAREEEASGRRSKAPNEIALLIKPFEAKALLEALHQALGPAF